MKIVCDYCHQEVGRCPNCIEEFLPEEDILCVNEEHYCDETCLVESISTEARTIEEKE